MLALFVLNPTSVLAQSAVWNGGSGTWDNPIDWSTGVVPNSSGTDVYIDNGNSVVSSVAIPFYDYYTIHNLFIDSDDSVVFSDRAGLIVAGSTLKNSNKNGGLVFTGCLYGSSLNLAGGVTLQGGGTVSLPDCQPGVIQGNGGPNDTLTNLDNTIQGSGTIGNNSGGPALILVNQPAGVINANQKTALGIAVGAKGGSNQGIMEATVGLSNPGELFFSAQWYQGGSTNGVFNNNNGIIQAVGPGTAVVLGGAVTIAGGLLTTSNGGVIESGFADSAYLDGVTDGTLTNAGAYVLGERNATILKGVINNTGSISLYPNIYGTLLNASGSVTLEGGGTVTMANVPNQGAQIESNGGGSDSLTNVDNTIQGTGTIGNNSGGGAMLFVNQSNGIINANQSRPLTIAVPSIGVINQGMMEATNGGTLGLNAQWYQGGSTGGTLNNAGGVIRAVGPGATVALGGAVTVAGGILTTSRGGVIGSGFADSAVLDGSTAGGLTNAGAYALWERNTTVLKGLINNTGTISLYPNIYGSSLNISGGVTLKGGGTVTMANVPNQGALVEGNGGTSDTLTNVDNTIQGTGTIGNNSGGPPVLLVNHSKGVINANQSRQLNIAVPAGGVVNQGTMEATNGAVLVLTAQLGGGGYSYGMITNSGTLVAVGSESALEVLYGAGLTNTGTIKVTNGAYFAMMGGAFPNYVNGNTLSGGKYVVDGELQIRNFDITTNAADITLIGTNAKIIDQFNNNSLAALATNANGAKFTLTGNANFTAEAFANSGTVTISKGSTFAVGSSGAYTQRGVTSSTIVDGTLTTLQLVSFRSGSLSLTSPGAVTVFSGAVYGTGQIVADLQSSGGVIPGDSLTSPGTLSVNGNYLQTATGGLYVSIAGASSAGQLNVSGEAILGGTLNIRRLNGFVPAVGSIFTVLNFSSRKNTFSTVLGAAINNNEHFVVVYNSNNVTLKVVSGSL